MKRKCGDSSQIAGISSTGQEGQEVKTDKKKGREDRNHSPAAAAASVRWLIRNMRCTCFESGSRSWLLLSILTMCTWPRAAARVYLGSRKVRHLSWRRQRKYGRKTVAVRTSRRGVPDPHSSSSTSCRPGPRLQRPVRLNTNAQMSDARAWKQKNCWGLRVASYPASVSASATLSWQGARR